MKCKIAKLRQIQMNAGHNTIFVVFLWNRNIFPLNGFPIGFGNWATEKNIIGFLHFHLKKRRGLDMKYLFEYVKDT